MLVMVVVIYAFCWMPLNVINIAGIIDPSIYNANGMNYVWMATHWLAMSNCMYNPFIYCWLNSKFRDGFTRVLKCFTCGYVNNADEMELQRLRRQETSSTSCGANGGNINGGSTLATNGSLYRFNSTKSAKLTVTYQYHDYTRDYLSCHHSKR